MTSQVLFNPLTYIDRLTRGGFTPGLSSTRGGFTPGLSDSAKAEPATAQHAAKTISLDFMNSPSVWLDMRNGRPPKIGDRLWLKATDENKFPHVHEKKLVVTASPPTAHPKLPRLTSRS